jgi:biopolymer transport protein ExbD
MDGKIREFDVWIVETNTVYRQVPFTVVTDWIQQGRLLEADRVRPSKTEQWATLATTPAFAPYLPKPQPFRAEDRAEALEAVHGDISWKSRGGDADEDVDMIPLIDVSLVLLIFFMMTAAVGGAGSIFNTPEAKYKTLTKTGGFWIGIKAGEDGQPAYSLGQGEKGDGVTYDNRSAVLAALREQLAQVTEPVNLTVRADRRLPCDLVIQDLAVELEGFRRNGKVAEIFTEVSERTTP